MTYFHYQDDILHAEQVSIIDIANSVGTPFYCYSANSIIDRYNQLKSAFSGIDCLIAYAMKANSNQAILSLLAKQGAGADIVSLGELERAIKANIPPQKIIFSGVGKSKKELRRALELNVHCFNLESEAELDRLNIIADEMGKIAPVSLRINPNVDAKTHKKITTGTSENKFGISHKDAMRIYEKIANSPNLTAIGIDMHIGSQIIDLEPYDNAFALLKNLVIDLKAKGHRISHIDVGGGLGIAHGQGEKEPDIDAYAKIVRSHLSNLDCTLVLEPGRWLVGNAGILVTKVEYIKHGENKDFVIVNAGMNDLLRPTLYEAHHDILAVEHENGKENMFADIVGPICESGDYLAQSRTLPKAKQGDLLAIMSAGAYGAVMAGTYNSRPRIPEVLVKDNHFEIIRRRQKIEDLIALDSVPSWI